MRSIKQQRFCQIKSCINNLGTVNTEVRFFLIGAHPEWKNIMKEQQANINGAICDRHFTSNCLDNKRKLVKEALPTIFEYENRKARTKIPDGCAACPGHVEMVEKLTVSLIELQEQHKAALQSEMTYRKKAEKLEKTNKKLVEKVKLKDAEITALKTSLQKGIKNRDNLKTIITMLMERKLLSKDHAKHLHVRKFTFII